MFWRRRAEPLSDTETIAAFCDAWSRRAWSEMVRYTQKHFVASLGGKKKCAEFLSRNFFQFLPGPIDTIEWLPAPGLNRKVARQFDVGLELHGQAPPIFRTHLKFMLVREHKYDKTRPPKRWWRKLRASLKRVRYTPVPDASEAGTWGVNPISILRGGGKSR